MHLIDAYTLIGSGVAADELDDAVTAWFRVRAVGDEHKVRWWLDGEGEPGTWQMERTDSTYTTGRLMLGAFTPTDVVFDDLTVMET